jgi:hypothetical protein
MTTDARYVHPEGKDYSRSTYALGCRCEGCSAANRRYQRDRRRARTDVRRDARITTRTRTLAAKWLKEHHPDVWAEVVAEATRDIDRTGDLDRRYAANKVAREGVTRCDCGSKYWEHDRCVDCGTHANSVTATDDTY